MCTIAQNNIWYATWRWNQMFSSAGSSQEMFGRMNRMRLRSTGGQRFSTLLSDESRVGRDQDRYVVPPPERMSEGAHSLGTRINPPSKARTSPAPREVHTDHRRALSAARRSLLHCEYHPYATIVSRCPDFAKYNQTLPAYTLVRAGCNSQRPRCVPYHRTLKTSRRPVCPQRGPGR